MSVLMFTKCDHKSLVSEYGSVHVLHFSYPSESIHKSLIVIRLVLITNVKCAWVLQKLFLLFATKGSFYIKHMNFLVAKCILFLYYYLYFSVLFSKLKILLHIRAKTWTRKMRHLSQGKFKWDMKKLNNIKINIIF